MRRVKRSRARHRSPKRPPNWGSGISGTLPRTIRPCSASCRRRRIAGTSSRSACAAHRVVPVEGQPRGIATCASCVCAARPVPHCRHLLKRLDLAAMWNRVAVALVKIGSSIDGRASSCVAAGTRGFRLLGRTRSAVQPSKSAQTPGYHTQLPIPTRSSRLHDHGARQQYLKYCLRGSWRHAAPDPCGLAAPKGPRRENVFSSRQLGAFPIRGRTSTRNVLSDSTGFQTLESIGYVC